MTMPPDPTPNPYGTRGEPAVSGTGTAGQSVTGTPSSTMATTAPAATSAAALSLDTTQIKDPATRSLVEGLIKQETAYGANIATAAKAYHDAAERLSEAYAKDPNDPGIRWLTTNVDSTLATWSTAQANLAKAHDTIATTIQHAIDSRSLEPQWSALADKYTADAEQIRQQTQAAAAAAPAQRDLLVAQATQATAQAALDNANAANIKATTPATIEQLQAHARQADAQAQLLSAQAHLEAGKLPWQERTNEASTQSLETAAAMAKRQFESMLSPEQVQAKNQAETLSAQLDAAQKGASLLKGQQGPLYGLPQQLSAIRDAVNSIADGAKSGRLPSDPDSLNNLLGQYITATVGGTTIAGGSQLAQQAQEAAQRSLETQRQQNIGLLQQGMSTMGGMVNAAVPGLLGMVKDLPAGSTALGPAIQDIYKLASNAVQAPQFQPPPVIQPPPLPPFLQSFAAPKSDAASVAAAAVHAAVSASQQPSTPAPAAPTPATSAPTAAPAGPEAFAQSGLAEGSARGLPGMLQPHAPADTSFVNSLWGRAA